MKKVLIIFAMTLVTQTGYCLSQDDMTKKVVEAAAKQTGLDKKLDLFGKQLYDEIVPVEYRKYVDFGVGIADSFLKQQIVIVKKWEF